jgi:hypothetical protein
VVFTASKGFRVESVAVPEVDLAVLEIGDVGRRIAFHDNEVGVSCRPRSSRSRAIQDRVSALCSVMLL